MHSFGNYPLWVNDDSELKSSLVRSFSQKSHAWKALCFASQECTQSRVGQNVAAVTSPPPSPLLYF